MWLCVKELVCGVAIGENSPQSWIGNYFPGGRESRGMVVVPQRVIATGCGGSEDGLALSLACSVRLDGKYKQRRVRDPQRPVLFGQSPVQLLLCISAHGALRQMIQVAFVDN